MISLFNNIGGLNQESFHRPKITTTIIQDSFQRNNNTRNIYIQLEPEAIRPVEKQIIENANNYDFILTFNDTVLKKCSNAYKYLFGMTRILPNDMNNININNKKFTITSVTNDKLMTIGHHFRHSIYYKQEHILNIPTNFFLSNDCRSLPIIKNNPRLGGPCESKIDLFKESQFSLVIENSRQINYFTEKLGDCLITKTIPIYYGCPNISEFFDVTGWIILDNESTDELIEKVKLLTPDYYLKYINIINKNFELVKQYIDLQENLNRTLRAIPEY